MAITVLRPISHHDTPQLLKIMEENHTGLTNLPETEAELSRLIEISTCSFSSEPLFPHHEQYAFVLEILPEKKILGISAILATTGNNHPLYFFKKEYLYQPTTSPFIPNTFAVLQAISYIQGPSTLCSLFLTKAVRKKGYGKLLSLGRLLYIAQNPLRFTETISTELRGTINASRNAPFWEYIGSHFLHMSYLQALNAFKLDRTLPKQFLPSHPIYIDLLPKEAKEVIGIPHLETKAAFSLIVREGFSPTDEFDVFDGGPKLSCERSHIRTIALSCTCKVKATHFDFGQQNLQSYLIAPLAAPFYATVAKASLEEDTLFIDDAICSTFGISNDSTVLCSPL
jgi:arginine N-succinyltransferase